MVACAGVGQRTRGIDRIGHRDRVGERGQEQA